MPQNVVSSRIGANQGCFPARILTEPFFRASTGHTAGFWHRCNSVSHFSVSFRGDCGRHGMQLCGAGACHALREQLCVRRWYGGWGFGARLPVPRARAGQRHWRIARQGANCFGGHHLRWQLRRGGARMVFEGGTRSKFAFEAAGVRPEQFFRIWCGALHHELEVCEALAEVQGPAGQLRAQRGQRDPRDDGA